MSKAFLSNIKKEVKLHVDSIKEDIKARRDPDFFWFTGTQVYCGKQGSGKTISAVKHILNINEKYPLSLLVSNIEFTNLRPRRVTVYPGKEGRTRTAVELAELVADLKDGKQSTDYILFTDAAELEVVLTQVNNGKLGVMYLVDEIHTYFNALDSKAMPPYVFTEISQQRKQRKLIVGTSQLFMRMAKPLREQCDTILICDTLFGVLTFQKAYDGMEIEQDYQGNLVGKRLKTGFFWHTQKLRESFDTYQKIQSSAIQLEEFTRTVESRKHGLLTGRR